MYTLEYIGVAVRQTRDGKNRCSLHKYKYLSDELCARFKLYIWTAAAHSRIIFYVFIVFFIISCRYNSAKISSKLYGPEKIRNITIEIQIKSAYLPVFSDGKNQFFGFQRFKIEFRRKIKRENCG